MRAAEGGGGGKGAVPLLLRDAGGERGELLKAGVDEGEDGLGPLLDAADLGHYPKRALKILAEERALLERDAGYARLALEAVGHVGGGGAENDVRAGQDYRLAVVGGAPGGVRAHDALVRPGLLRDVGVGRERAYVAAGHAGVARDHIAQAQVHSHARRVAQHDYALHRLGHAHLPAQGVDYDAPSGLRRGFRLSAAGREAERQRGEYDKCYNLPQIRITSVFCIINRAAVPRKPPGGLGRRDFFHSAPPEYLARMRIRLRRRGVSSSAMYAAP